MLYRWKIMGANVTLCISRNGQKFVSFVLAEHNWIQTKAARRSFACCRRAGDVYETWLHWTVPVRIVFYRGVGTGPADPAADTNFYVHIVSTFANVNWFSGQFSISDATRCQILRLKCIKFCSRWGSTMQTLLEEFTALPLSLIHIWRCRRSYACRSRWSPYH